MAPKKRSLSHPSEQNNLISSDQNNICLDQLKTLISKSGKVLAASTVDKSLHNFAEGACSLVDAGHAVIAYRHEYQAYFMTGAPGTAKGFKIPDASEIKKDRVYVALTRKKNAVRLSKQVFSRPPSAWGFPSRRPDLRGLLGIPLLTTGGDFEGAILLSNKKSGDFTENDEGLLRQFTALVSGNLQYIHSLEEAKHRASEAAETAARLEANRSEYEVMVEEANSIFIKTDREGKITFFNNYAQKLFGYSSTEILGKNVRMLLPPTESTGRNLLKMADDILRNPDKFVENINENILKDGTRVWISWRNKGIRDKKGNISETLAIGQDITKLVYSEAALRESEQRFRSLFENSLYGIMITVNDGRVISANAKMCEMLGMSEAEIITRGRDGIVVQDEKLEAGLEERARTGRFLGELTYRRKDNSLVPVEISVCTFQDRDGTIKSGQIVRDITDRKQMDLLLQKAHDSLEEKVALQTEEVRKEAELLDLAHDAIIVSEKDGKILFWSNGAAEMYGWTREEAVGRKIQEILKPVFPVPFKRIMDDTLSRGRWEGELMHTRKNGEQLIVLSRWALRISASGRPEIMEVNSNISTRKEIEEALKQTVLYNRSLIEANLDPLVTIGPEGKITDVNASTEKATGFSRNELIGTDFSDYFTDPGKARAGYEKVFREGIVRDYELVIKHRDGQTTPVFYNASIYKDSSGNISGVFAAARDVTERKQTEEELKEKSRVLEELNTALKVLINRYKNDEKELEERITSSIRMGITPYIAKLKETRQDVRQSAITEIIESTLEDITSPFFKAISSEHFRFSPKEIEIISYIRQGKTTKEMAQLLGLGNRTIDSYRDNIRNKLGLSSKKINLRTYLLSIINT